MEVDGVTLRRNDQLTNWMADEKGKTEGKKDEVILPGCLLTFHHSDDRLLRGIFPQRKINTSLNQNDKSNFKLTDFKNSVSCSHT